MAAARKVLIADDEPNVVTSLEFLMKGCDYEVRVARDGEEAMRLAQDFRPDLLLLDVMMPVCDGLEVCRRIRADPAHITKPFSNKELVAKVRSLLQPAP